MKILLNNKEKSKMKKILISLIASLFTLNSYAAGNPKAPEKENNWKIDREIKFHYAFFNDKQDKSTKFRFCKPVNFEGEFKPDISNITLDGILGLGFPLPAKNKSEDYKFYLKFFNYPDFLDPKTSAQRTLTPFMLYQLKNSNELYKFIGSRKNLYIKSGFIEDKNFPFSEKNPFPELKFPEFEKMPAQAIFDNSLPFASLYLLPGFNILKDLSEDKKINLSSKGVISFHKEITDIYKKNMTEVTGIESDKYYYFYYNSWNNNLNNSFQIIKVPREPMVFNNAKDLPMPNNPKHIFLSGLLLIYRTSYFSKEPLTKIEVDSNDFKAKTVKTGENILEVGSVVRL